MYSQAKVLFIFATLHHHARCFPIVDRYYTELPVSQTGWEWAMVGDQSYPRFDPHALIQLIEDPNANYIYAPTDLSPFSKPKIETPYRYADNRWDLAAVTQLLEKMAELEGRKRRYEENEGGFYLLPAQGIELGKRSIVPYGRIPSLAVNTATNRPFHTADKLNQLHPTNTTDQHLQTSPTYTSVAAGPNLSFLVQDPIPMTIPFPPHYPFAVHYEHGVVAPQVMYTSSPFMQYQGWPVTPPVWVNNPLYQTPPFGTLQQLQIAQDSRIHYNNPLGSYSFNGVLASNAAPEQQLQDSKIYDSYPIYEFPSYNVTDSQQLQHSPVPQDSKIYNGTALQVTAEQEIKKLMKVLNPINTNLTQTVIDPVTENRNAVKNESNVPSWNGEEIRGSEWKNSWAEFAQPISMNVTLSKPKRRNVNQSSKLMHKENKPQRFRVMYHLQKSYVPVP